MTTTVKPSQLDILKDVAEVRNGPCQVTGIYHHTNCPGPHHEHGDRNPSLSFYEKEGDDGLTYVEVRCWSGVCTRDEVLKGFGLDPHSLKGGYRSPTRTEPVLTIFDVQEHVKIDWRFLANLGLEDGVAITLHNGAREYKERGVLIPYHYADGRRFEKKRIRIRLQDNGNKKRFKWGEGDWKPIAYGLDRLQAARDAGYVVIVEGESDCWTLWLHDIPALGLPGATTITNTLDGALLSGIPRVYVVQEWSGDQAGINFPYKVKLQLESTGYTGEVRRVPLLVLTGEKDPNGLHKKSLAECAGKFEQSRPRFIETFQDVLSKAKEMEGDTGEDEIDLSIIEKALDEKDAVTLLKHARVLALLSPEDYAIMRMRIKSTLGKDISMGMLDKVVYSVPAGQGIGAKLDLDQLAQVFYERYGDTHAYDAARQAWKIWTGTHWDEAVSAEGEKLTLDNVFTDLMHEMGIEVMSNSALDCIHRRAKGKCARVFMATPGLINFKNGTLHVDIKTLTAREFRPHRKEDYLQYCLDYDYEAGQFANIQAFLDEAMPDRHAQQAYMAHLGLALLGDTSMQYYLFLYGTPRSGKSTCLRLAYAVCGHPLSDYSSYAGDVLFFSDLEGSRQRYQFFNRRIVCADELKPETFRENENIIKTMTGHGGVPIRGMNKDAQVDNQWRPKLAMSANELPHYKDTSGALKRRTLILHFPNSKEEEEQDPLLFTRLLDELGPFTYSCIRMALAVLQRRYFPKSAKMKECSREASSTGNALRTFVEDHCILQRDHKDAEAREFTTFSSVIHNSYKNYCEENGHKAGSTATMTIALKEMNLGITSSPHVVRLPSYGKPGRALYGIRLRNDQDPVSDGDEQARERRMIDDALLSRSNDFVTTCNECNDDVTADFETRYTAQNEDTSQFSKDDPAFCNDVTMFSSFLAPTREKETAERDESSFFPIGVNKPENIVTSLQNSTGRLLEQAEPYNDSEKTSLQARYTSLHSLQPATTLDEAFEQIGFSQHEAYALFTQVKTTPAWRSYPESEKATRWAELKGKLLSGVPGQMIAAIADMQGYLTKGA